MLDRVKRRATKIMPKLKDRDISYEICLYALTTLETRRLRGDQLEVFKIFNGCENIDRYIFALANKQCKLDIRTFLFSQRTIIYGTYQIR